MKFFGLRRQDRTRYYMIGQHRLRLPPGNRLDKLQKKWTAYDVALGDISRLVFTKYPGSSALDIGANIGDSAALISKYLNVPILCIEGVPEFLPWLRKNAARIGPDITIWEGFVGEYDQYVDLSNLKTSAGSASIVNTMFTSKRMHDKSIPVLSLREILASYPDFGSIKLLKSDTDGFDFKILSSSTEVITRHQPVIFFEFDPKLSPNGNDEAISCIDNLMSIGYRRFMVYDNFGNFLVTIDDRAKFEEINSYLASNRQNGIAIHYFDVCAFTDKDMDISEQLRQLILNRYDSSIL